MSEAIPGMTTNFRIESEHKVFEPLQIGQGLLKATNKKKCTENDSRKRSTRISAEPL